MAFVESIQGALEFTRNGTTAFAGIGLVVPGETRLLGSRVGLGFAAIRGIALVTAAVPGLVAGTLSIEQSMDGTNWDEVSSFSMTLAGGVVPFGISIVGRFVRVRFAVPAGEVYDVRFGAHMQPHT